MNTEYDLLPTATSNINAYNRYPFSCYAEAVNSIKEKNLLPGELAVAYYFDENTVLGINAVLGFGNLKHAGNIIFKNPEELDLEIEETNKKISKQVHAMNQMIESINHANKNWSEILNKVEELEKLFKQTNDTLHVLVIDLDNYEIDL